MFPCYDVYSIMILHLALTQQRSNEHHPHHQSYNQHQHAPGMQPQASPRQSPLSSPPRSPHGPQPPGPYPHHQQQSTPPPRSPNRTQQGQGAATDQRLSHEEVCMKFYWSEFPSHFCIKIEIHINCGIEDMSCNQ